MILFLYHFTQHTIHNLMVIQYHHNQIVILKILFTVISPKQIQSLCKDIELGLFAYLLINMTINIC